MPHCVYCRARTTDFVVLPKLGSSSIQRWLTTYGLDAGQLSAGRNVICSLHTRDVKVDLAHTSDTTANNPTSLGAEGESVQDQRLQQVLSSMGNVSFKEMAPTESDCPSPENRIPTLSAAAQSEIGPGPSPESRTSALPMPPATPTQVCDVSSTSSTADSGAQECPVCLQTLHLPIKLPCNHIFCFLCAKGFASQHGRCAYCRAEIPVGYMQLPTVVPQNQEENPGPDTKYFWYYAGRNGWWQFEERHCEELEEALLKGDSQYELQVSGFMYVIDLLQMVQYRKDRPGRTRRIKRDLVTAPRKGVAGLREDLINGSLI